MSTADRAAPHGVIHDIGFRHYTGQRLGRRWARRSLLIETLRGAYGLGRPAKSRIMAWLLLGLYVAPALIVVTVAITTKADHLALSYTNYSVALSLLTTLFVAGRAPYAVSRDLRDGVIPLYLSRPLSRLDYVAAKFIGLWLAVTLFLAAPITVLLIGSLLAKMRIGDAVTGWLGGMLMVAILAAVLTGIGLALASFTKRRGLGVAAIVTSLVMAMGISPLVTSVVNTQVSVEAGTYGALIDPYRLVDGLAAGWLGVDPSDAMMAPVNGAGTTVFTLAMLAVVGACLAVLTARFKKVGRV